MNWIKKQLTKWWVWLLLSALFLAVVQYLFYTPAPYPWLDAVWEAGDFISLVGTLVLGYIAMLQTKRANDTAADANKTSRMMMDLQKAEYTPVVTIASFAGITKHEVTNNLQSNPSEVIVHEMRCHDGEVLVGHSISLRDDGFDLQKKAYCRDYELHLEYSGHFVMESFQIKEISFVGKSFEKNFTIQNSLEMSLSRNEKFKLFIFLASNEDFMDEKCRAHEYITATHIVFKIEMKSLTGETYTETIKLRKLLVMKPSPKLDVPDAEMLVSATYHVQQ